MVLRRRRTAPTTEAQSARTRSATDPTRPLQPPAIQAQLEPALPAGQPLTSHRLERLHRLLVVRRPEMLDVAHRVREPYTIWTGVAPDLVRTVRTHATRADYEPSRSQIVGPIASSGFHSRDPLPSPEAPTRAVACSAG
jgi:hypothetical protein